MYVNKGVTVSQFFQMVIVTITCPNHLTYAVRAAGVGIGHGDCNQRYEIINPDLWTLITCCRTGTWEGEGGTTGYL